MPNLQSAALSNVCQFGIYKRVILIKQCACTRKGRVVETSRQNVLCGQQIERDTQQNIERESKPQ
jgi:hypothetical protein